MLKWTASAQKLTLDSTTNIMPQTPCRSELEHRKRRARRATIANKENIPYATSTPMVRSTRNSPIVLAPLADILNITPEFKSPALRSLETEISTHVELTTDTTLRMKRPNNLARNRRHSTLGITLPSAVPVYARTLPRFQVEEYSPSTSSSPTGQQLALRGLIPDPFLGNARYFTTPEIKQQQQQHQENSTQHCNASTILTKTMLKKRKLDLEFTDECEQKFLKTAAMDATTLNSAKMGDETLDKLIDAILDSARKDCKKKKTRKSFNLRRRTLLRNQPETLHEVVLSPSYTAADDPASDLSFLQVEKTVETVMSSSQASASTTPQLPQTPTPMTPLPGTPISTSELCKFQTPTPQPITNALNISTTTFKLETPLRPFRTRKRRQTHDFGTDATASTNQAKKFKVDKKNYFEIGVALPSIYV